jgi:hypothetical protein
MTYFEYLVFGGGNVCFDIKGMGYQHSQLLVLFNYHNTKCVINKIKQISQLELQVLNLCIRNWVFYSSTDRNFIPHV